MPHKPQPKTPPAVVKERLLIWSQTGQRNEPTLSEWDPKAQQVVQAILEVLATGSTLMIRPGSGSRSIGIAIWEGDFRHPYEWLYEAEEMDNWAGGILTAVEGMRAKAAD